MGLLKTQTVDNIDMDSGSVRFSIIFRQANNLSSIHAITSARDGKLRLYIVVLKHTKGETYSLTDSIWVMLQ